ncbi:hypothetical protein V6R21_19060 [Limibacter armeniacum]|uniref:hypothetical protein n=1 Tax=Limibacter armeniacum TaxID=466084 RepID=UPI002FE6BD0D
MIYVLSCEITAGKLRTRHVARVQVRSTWRELTDTAVIELPRNLDLKGKSLDEVVKRGDRVDIFLGYNGGLKREFTGFVRKVERDVPVRIYCEDYAYLLDRKVEPKAWASVTLEGLVTYLTAGLGIASEVVDVNLGKVRLEKGSIADVLMQVRDTFGLVAYFRHNPDNNTRPTLFVGFPYDLVTDKDTAILHRQRNVANSSGLKYQGKEDVQVTIRAISNAADKTAKKTVVEVGSGPVRTRNYMPGLSKEQLRSLATKELDNLRVDGFSGSLESFGIPYIAHGDAVRIIDQQYVDEDARYLSDGVDIEFSDTFRRKVKIGKKL